VNILRTTEAVFQRSLLSPELRHVRGFIFDIDGTLALMDKKEHRLDPFDGAIAVVEHLNRLNIPVIPFTNGTFQTPREYSDLLFNAGFRFVGSDVLTPSVVAAEYFVKHKIGKVLVLGGPSVSHSLTELGIEVVRTGGDAKGIQAVLVGWFPEFTMPDMQAACDAVWGGAQLFTVSNAPFFAGANGRILGVSGAISAMITSTTKARVTVLGKPSLHGLRLACHRMGINPCEVAVVGDDPSLEIAMARKAGAVGIGVMTGIAKRPAFDALPQDHAAHIVLDSVGDLLRTGLLDAA